MKPVRALAVVLGGLVVLVAMAAAVAFNSSFQTWLARRELAQQPGLHGTLGSLAAGLTKVEVRDLKIESQGVVLTLPAFEAQLPVVSAGLGHKIRIGRLVARGWTLDLTKAAAFAAGGPARDRDFGRLLRSLLADTQTTAARRRVREFSLLSSAYAADPGPPAADVFRGIFAPLALAFDLELDGVDLAGEVIMPRPGGGEPARLQVTMNGGGLAAGRAGRFRLDLGEARNDGGALTLQAVIEAAMDSPRTFRELGVKGDATASGPQFPKGVKLAIGATAMRTAAGETYTFSAAGGGKRLASANGELSTVTSRLSGRWTANLDRSDIAPFVLGRALPRFSIAGKGTFESGGTWQEVHATGRLNAAANGLEVVRPELAAVGAMKLEADFDVLWHGNSLRVDRFDATLAGTAPVAHARALQPFEFDLRTAGMNVADPAQDLVVLTLADVPLAWARPWLGNVALTGGNLRGELTGSARGGGLALRARQPLTIAGLAVAQAGRPLVRELDVSLDASADYTPDGWQAQVIKFTASHAGTAILSLEAKAGRLAAKDAPLKFTGHWRADLAGWSAQPAVAGGWLLAAGVAEGEFAGSGNGAAVVEAKLALSDLATTAKEKLPALELESHVEVGTDGRIAFSAPVLVTNGARKSDFAVSGTLAPGTPARIEARLSGDQIYADDVMALAALMPAGEPAATPAANTGGAAVAKADAAPVWSAVGGHVTLAVKKAIFGESFEVTNLGGSVRLEAGALTLDGVTAGFGPDSDLKASGEVKFDAKAKAPYALAADVALNNFDTAPAFRALDPAKPPTIETNLNLTGHVIGDGANFPELAERLRGELQLTGRGGIFRGLPVSLANKLPKNQTTAAMIGGIIGAVTGKKDVADDVQDLLSLAKTLSEIPFDQLSVKAVRGDNLDVQLQNFTLIAPELRLTGNGSIQHVDAQPLLQQPLEVAVTIGARGKSGELMRRLKLLDAAKKDGLGYTAMVLPVKVGGTLEKPNVDQFGTDLVKYVIERTGILNSIWPK